MRGDDTHEWKDETYENTRFLAAASHITTAPSQPPVANVPYRG
jgi:hypothetical protein